MASSASFPFWKRLFDLTCVLLTVPLWLPLMVMVTLWIKLVSRGPIFFRQERVGLGGKRFMILKFRSMKVNAETRVHEAHMEYLMRADCPMNKLDNAGDARLIPLGKILRAVGVDELPQLFNVLCGEMSLVGPRPCTPYEFQHYQAWQKERVNAPPGLTGYWQIKGKNKTTFSEMVTLDIYYVKHMSIWLDVLIIARTPHAVLVQFLDSTRAHTAMLRPKTEGPVIVNSLVKSRTITGLGSGINKL